MRVRYFRFLFLLMAVLSIGLPLAAQDGTVTLQLAVPEFLKETFDADLIAEFESQNPGIKLDVISGGGFAAPPAFGIDAHLEDVQEYVSSADVVFVNSSSLTPESTNAGYFLDLSPLTSADPSLNIDDFIPAAWQSFQWDRAVWALPVSVDAILLIYNRKAFDEAGLAYPNGSWTLDDFANAARALTKRDAEGEITNPGYIDYGNTKYMLRSLLGASLVDTTTTPSQPVLTNPKLESLLTTWQSLKDEGVVGGIGGGSSVVIVGGGGDGPAMSIQQSFGLASFPGAQGDPPAGSLLPGGKAGLEVQGFAISAGTQYPEQAYALAKFLTFSVDVANNLFGSTPARKSLAGIEADMSNRPFGGLAFTPENQAVIDEAFANAIPVSEMLFADYLNVAIETMNQDGVDSRTALQEAEVQAINSLSTAAERQTTIIAVATPVPEVVLNPGEIALNFGLTSFISPLPNQEQWDQIISNFVASDPQVGQIVMDVARDTNLDAMAAGYDCFYIPTNSVSDGNLDSVLNLDPYMDADPSFDKSDVIGNTLGQVQSDNKTWAFPIVIQPEVLRYNSEMFERAGVELPENGWTIDAFADALKVLKDSSPDTKPFVPRGFGSDYLLSMIAAYGGLPLDYRTTPVTINFTDPATVEAIRQALDLVKEGYLDYTALARPAGGAVAIFAIADSEETNAITTHSLSALNLFTREEFVGNDPYRLVTYPQGSQYTTISYNVGTAYISTDAQNPEACYRWLSELSRHPELFSAMPARRSLINDPAVTASQSPDTIALYNQIDNLLGQPNVIALPSGLGGSPESMWVRNWLNRAFDRYINEDANLEDELTQAEMFAKDYQQCAAAIPALDPESGEDPRAYFQQFMDCATSVDPTITS